MHFRWHVEKWKSTNGLLKTPMPIEEQKLVYLFRAPQGNTQLLIDWQYSD